MAEVTFIIGEHPTEVVASYHARKVAEILRREYGHKVIFEKVPLHTTSYGKLREDRPMKETLLKLAREPLNSNLLAQQAALAFGTPVVNFHSTPANKMGKATTKQPRDFNVGKALTSAAELAVAHVGSNGFIVEVPALYQDVLERTLEKLVANGYAREAMALLDGNELTANEKKTLVINMRTNNQLRVAGLKTPGQEKYLHPDISRKLAEEIHKQITASPIRRLARAAKYVLEQRKEERKARK
ncbi:MAG: hypothetical protein V1722_00150 [Candidatus Micrarchaeota archaeon]